MNYNESLKQVSDYVISFFASHTNADIIYHNQAHTLALIDAVNRISADVQPDERSRFIALSAAWFYDTGYFVTGADQPKNRSAALAAEFLKSMGADEADINEIKKCITVTRIPQQPVTTAEKIICDAALYYLGSESFPEKNRLLRRETASIEKIKISSKEWRDKSIALLEAHRYFTAHCQTNLDKTKQENLNRLKTKQEEKAAKDLLKSSAPAAVMPRPATEPYEPGLPGIEVAGQPVAATDKTKKKKRKKEKRPARGMEIVFRVASANHQRLSVQADSKAHIMISVNSIIISVVLGLIVRNMDSRSYIVIPTVLLLGVNVITIIFSVLATRPRLPNGIFTKEQVEQKDVDLTFFGNYYKMLFEDYKKGMHEMMHDNDFLHGGMIRNLYGQAKVLGRKFSLLRISYTIFMYGIALAVLAYVAALVLGR